MMEQKRWLPLCEKCGKNPASPEVRKKMEETGGLKNFCDACYEKIYAKVIEERKEQESLQSIPVKHRPNPNEIICPRCFYSYFPLSKKPGLFPLCEDCIEQTNKEWREQEEKEKALRQERDRQRQEALAAKTAEKERDMKLRESLYALVEAEESLADAKTKASLVMAICQLQNKIISTL